MKNKLISIVLLLASIPTLVFAHGYGWDQGWGGHMGNMGGNWGNQMGFFGGGWMMILWILILLVGVVALVKWIINSKRKPAATDNALAIVAERYAKGEISLEEYNAMKKNLL